MHDPMSQIFQPPQNYALGGFGPQSIALGDVNGDGKPDLVVANACISASDCSSGTVSVLLG
jgi:FG-GAP repeat